MDNQDQFVKAKRRADAKLGFYIHLTVYVAVNALLVAINLATYRGHLWFAWPLIGWGIGILFHALATFHLLGRLSIRRRMVEREMKNQ